MSPRFNVAQPPRTCGRISSPNYFRDIILVMFKASPLLRDVFLFTIVALVVLPFWQNNLLVEVLLSLEFLLAAVFLYSKVETRTFLIAGFFGASLEVVGGAFNIWKYTYPNLFTIPIWIFFCWGFTFLLFHSVYLSLTPLNNHH